MELGEAQKRFPETLKSLESDLKIENLDFHETIEKSMKIIDFSSSEGQLGAQICLEEVLKLITKELEGAESKLREKKESKKLSRELQEAPKEAPRHDPLLSLPRDYELPRSCYSVRPCFGQASPELRRNFDASNLAIDVVGKNFLASS